MAGKSNSKRSVRPHRAERSDYFVTVVDFLPVSDADDAFRSWLVERGLHHDDLDPRDLYIDTASGGGGTVRRYRVHRDAIPQ